VRTNIEIDDELMHEAMEATHTTTKRAAVEACMRKTILLKRQEAIRDYFGKIQWEGDLDAMREGRFCDEKPAEAGQGTAGEPSHKSSGGKR